MIGKTGNDNEISFIVALHTHTHTSKMLVYMGRAEITHFIAPILQILKNYFYFIYPTEERMRYKLVQK